jgi:hypothetical protein
MEEAYNNNEAMGEDNGNHYEDYMVSLNDSVDTAVTLMANRIKTRLSFLAQFGSSKEKLEVSKKKWIGDILSFMEDKGVLSKVAKAALLEIL